jgi:hypothetical protein
MTTKFDPNRYAQVPGDPAFPPPSKKREEEYIEKMLRRDLINDYRDNTIPRREEG